MAAFADEVPATSSSSLATTSRRFVFRDESSGRALREIESETVQQRDVARKERFLTLAEMRRGATDASWAMGLSTPRSMTPTRARAADRMDG